MRDVLIGEITITKRSHRPVKRFVGTLLYRYKKRFNQGAVSNAKIRAFEAAFFLFFCLGEKKIPLEDKKEHD